MQVLYFGTEPKYILCTASLMVDHVPDHGTKYEENPFWQAVAAIMEECTRMDRPDLFLYFLFRLGGVENNRITDFNILYHKMSIAEC